MNTWRREIARKQLKDGTWRYDAIAILGKKRVYLRRCDTAEEANEAALDYIATGIKPPRRPRKFTAPERRACIRSPRVLGNGKTVWHVQGWHGNGRKRTPVFVGTFISLERAELAKATFAETGKKIGGTKHGDNRPKSKNPRKAKSTKPKVEKHRQSRSFIQAATHEETRIYAPRRVNPWAARYGGTY